LWFSLPFAVVAGGVANNSILEGPHTVTINNGKVFETPSPSTPAHARVLHANWQPHVSPGAPSRPP
jgi:hypothetical protein